MTQMNIDFFIGKNIKDVEQFFDLCWRAYMVDGEARILTMDVKPSRFNFAITNGIITDVKMG